MHPVRLFCWHFMAYPHLPADFDDKYDSGWITVPNKLWDNEKSRGLYQEYIDQLAYADELGVRVWARHLLRSFCFVHHAFASRCVSASWAGVIRLARISRSLAACLSPCAAARLSQM